MSVLRLLLAILTLAGLDSAAAVCLKEAALNRNPYFAVAGIGLMIAVAGVLMVTVELADLTIVSLGWIILFQVVVMLVDHFRYAVTPGRVQFIAIIVALVALVVAAIAPTKQQPVGAAVMIPAPRTPTLEEKLHEYMVATPTWRDARKDSQL